MNKLDESKTLVENEPRSQETAMKDLAQSEVNKKTKRENQRMLCKDLLIKSTQCKLSTENENKQESHQNRHVNAKNKNKSDNKRKRLYNNNNDNNNDNMKFKNTSSKIIDDEIPMLNLLMTSHLL